MSRRKTQDEFIKDVHKKYGKGYTVTSKYNSLTDKIGFKHECGHEWTILPSTMYQAKRNILCPKCLALEKGRVKYYRKFYEKYRKEEFRIVEGTYTYGRNNVKVKHRKCGLIITRRASDFLSKYYDSNNICEKCTEYKNKQEQINRIRGMISKHINHEEFEIVSGTTNKYKLRHKECGEEFYKYYGKINNPENKIPCPKCEEERRIRKEKELEYERRKREIYRKKKRDLSGKKFGYLTALEDVGVHGNTEWRSWKCKCVCGEITYVGSSNLRNGHTQSCGCNGRKVLKIKVNGKIYRRTDLTGEVFGKLTVTGVDTHQKDTNYTTWKCKCECGGERTTTQQVLMKGNANSCGCLRRDDIKGNKYGRLTVLRYDEIKSKDTGYTYWECKCECGTVKSIYVGHLKTGGTSSCGCIGMSYGEELIKEVLDKHSVNYEVEYWFEDLRDIKPLRYDFAIFNDKRELLGLIEFDGRQHFEESDLFIDTLEEIQHRDNLKDEYCKENNIPLTRIPYTQIAYVTEIVEKVLLNNGLI